MTIQNIPHLTENNCNMQIEKYSTERDLLKKGSPLFCDLYHLTMAQAWFYTNRHTKIKTSETFFRKNPFNGGYLISAGLGEFLEWINNWSFKKADINYLDSLCNDNGVKLFQRPFLEYLQKTPLQISIKAVPEGEIVFPNEPIFSVTGPSYQVELIEAALLNIFNSQSLITTKASRICYAAALDGIQRPVLEFGLRRCQELGGFSATRASFIGGCSKTSNVQAARYYNIAPDGTMAHSFIQSRLSELQAFKDYLKSPNANKTLLVDTKNTHQGILNAIKSSRQTGIALDGIRIDSGDLAYWYHEAKKLFEEADMPYVKLIASNDLDEYIIKDLIMEQNAKYDIFAVGTKLVTAYDQPALGGIYKTKRFDTFDTIKVAEGKTTIPGATTFIRITREDQYAGDIILPASIKPIQNGQLTTDITSIQLYSEKNPVRTFKRGTAAQELLKDVVINGSIVSGDFSRSLSLIQQSVLENLKYLDDTHKRFIKPHRYGVGLEESLYQKRQKMIREANRSGAKNTA